jgi:tight adherence protein C
MGIIDSSVTGIIMFLVGFLIVGFGLSRTRSNELSPRLRNFVENPETGSLKSSNLLSMQVREVSGSITSRVVMPFFKRIGNFFTRMAPGKGTEELRKKLYIAGNPLGIGPIEFYGMRLAFGLAGVGLLFVLVRRGLNQTNVLVGILAFIACLLFPILWLRLKVNGSKNDLRKSFPSALDMLSVCVDAGLGFDQALQRVNEQWNTRLSFELGRVVNEMGMGLSRREAMRNLADRLDFSELSTFVAVILQSDQLGSSIAETLHAQADQMRVERRFRAQEKARTIPIKMLIPLAFLIFPAIMAILIGPAIPQLLGLFK